MSIKLKEPKGDYGRQVALKLAPLARSKNINDRRRFIDSVDSTLESLRHAHPNIYLSPGYENPNLTTLLKYLARKEPDEILRARAITKLIHRSKIEGMCDSY